MKKNSQGMPLNVIIIAAILLAVLVVVIVIFTKGSSIFAKDILSCENKGGDCVAKDKCQYQKSNFVCANREEICCINPSNV